MALRKRLQKEKNISVNNLNFQTKIPLSRETRNPIDYNSKIFLLGSCFSENIGAKFSYFKFQSVQNPFGILFHPKAIETFITNAINEKEYSEEDIFLLNERYHSFDSHSQLSDVSKDTLLGKLNEAILVSNKNIKDASHIIITLGTAWVYRFIESDALVANCHKVPQKKFLKELLSINEIIESLDSIIALIKNINPDVNFIFTVSPVRHLKDGFVQNQQSKSHLIAAIHQIVEPRKGLHYFPSYELMMDELRDYRFYAEDMIHPNQTAINYIWKKFSETWVSDSSKETMKKVDSIQKQKNHKPFNSTSETYQKFLAKTELEINSLKAKYPFINF